MVNTYFGTPLIGSNGIGSVVNKMQESSTEVPRLNHRVHAGSAGSQPHCSSLFRHVHEIVLYF
jgi:hypothetical protein